MFGGDPKPLEPGAIVSGFTPDPMCNYVVTYAGPCLGGCQAKDHEQLYVVPMIGWLHITSPAGFEMRPAIMSAVGIVTDYLDFPEPGKYRLIAVLQDADDTHMMAKTIYQARYGGRLDVGENPEIASATAN